MRFHSFSKTKHFKFNSQRLFASNAEGSLIAADYDFTFPRKDANSEKHQFYDLLEVKDVEKAKLIIGRNKDSSLISTRIEKLESQLNLMNDAFLASQLPFHIEDTIVTSYVPKSHRKFINNKVGKFWEFAKDEEDVMKYYQKFADDFRSLTKRNYSNEEIVRVFQVVKAPRSQYAHPYVWTESESTQAMERVATYMESHGTPKNEVKKYKDYHSALVALLKAKNENRE